MLKKWPSVRCMVNECDFMGTAGACPILAQKVPASEVACFCNVSEVQKDIMPINITLSLMKQRRAKQWCNDETSVAVPHINARTCYKASIGNIQELKTPKPRPGRRW